jgi:hypothetical protein
MSVSCLNEICCEEDLASCFKEICGDQGKFDSSIAAIAIVENDSFPKIGETVTLSTEALPVVLTECNYIDSLLQWIRDKQYACVGGGKYYHFLHNGLIAKGTRAKATSKYSENGSNYSSPKYLSYETTSEIMLEENYLPNAEVLCAIKQRASSLSIIYFFKQGGFVLDSDDDHLVYISEDGFEVTGTKNDFIMGSITLTESGKCQPAPFYSQDSKKFIKALKTATGFTFDTPTVTGLVAAACGSSGTCKAYSIAPLTPFTYTPNVKELVACGEFTLYQDCRPEDIKDITIDAVTGLIESTGLPAGEYKFTIGVKNACCITGNQCFLISVK